MNKDPVVIHPQGADLAVPLLVYSEAVHSVRVVAADPEGEILTFFWKIPRSGGVELPVNTFQTDAGDWQSNVSIPVEYLRDGEAIEVEISDQAQPRGIATVQWLVEFRE